MRDPEVPEDVALALEVGLDRLNELATPAYFPTPLQANFRHLCVKARQAQLTGKGVSTAIDLKELYVTGWNEDGSPRINEEGAEHAILVRQGTCKSCKQVARSREGRVVLTANRPPVHGRVSRN